MVATCFVALGSSDASLEREFLRTCRQCHGRILIDLCKVLMRPYWSCATLFEGACAYLTSLPTSSSRLTPIRGGEMPLANVFGMSDK